MLDWNRERKLGVKRREEGVRERRGYTVFWLDKEWLKRKEEEKLQRGNKKKEERNDKERGKGTIYSILIG